MLVVSSCSRNPHNACSLYLIFLIFWVSFWMSLKTLSSGHIISLLLCRLPKLHQLILFKWTGQLAKSRWAAICHYLGPMMWLLGLLLMVLLICCYLNHLPVWMLGSWLMVLLICLYLGHLPRRMLGSLLMVLLICHYLDHLPMWMLGSSLMDLTIWKFALNTNISSSMNIFVNVRLYFVSDPIAAARINLGPVSVWVLGSLVAVLICCIGLIAKCPWLRPCLDPPQPKQSMDF